MSIEIGADLDLVEATPARRRIRPRGLSVGGWISAALLALVVTAALAPGLFTSLDPLGIDPVSAFQAPSPAHPFGTDESGRDVFTRVVHGAGSSLMIGLAATAIGVGLALVLGLIGGLGGKIADFTVGRLLEVLFAFPILLLALVFIAIAGGGVLTSTIAVGLATAPGYARIIRTQVLSVRRSGYVEAAVVLGRHPFTIVRRHILPNVAATLFVLVTLGIGQGIVWASSLSFLGLGATPPAAEWGAMLSAGRTYIANAWWLTFFPGALIVLSAASATVLGHAIQRRLREK